MNKPLRLIPLMGMGWGIAYTPSVWSYIPYLMPIIAVSLIVAIVRALLTSKGDDG